MPPSGFMEPRPLAAPTEKGVVWGWDRAQGPLHLSFLILTRPRGQLTPPWCLQVAGSGSLPRQLVAPLSGNSLGTWRAEIKPGVHEIHLCKDEHGKTGLRLKAIDQVGLGAGQESRGHPPHSSPTSLGGGSAGLVHSKEGAEQAGEPRPTQRQAQALPLNLPPPRPQGWCWVPAAGTLHLLLLGSYHSDLAPSPLHQRGFQAAVWRQWKPGVPMPSLKARQSRGCGCSLQPGA